MAHKTRLGAVQKPKASSLGTIFFSVYSRKKGNIGRELVPLAVGRWGLRQDIHVVVEPCHRRNRRYQEQGLSLGNAHEKKNLVLKKVQVKSGDVKLAEIMTELDEGYVSKMGNVLIAAQKDLNGMQENWRNPCLKDFLMLAEAREKKEEVEKNCGSSSAYRFWKKYEDLHAVSIFMNFDISSAGTTALVASEIKHFLKPFDIWI